MLRNLSIGLRLHVMVMVMLAALGVVAWGGLGAVHDRLMAERQSQCRFLVSAALGHLRHYEELARQGRISLDEAKAHSIAAIAAMAGDDGQYLWINDLAPKVVWHPMAELIGRDVGDMRDSHGLTLFREFVLRTEAAKGAFIPYYWPKPGTREARPKLSYVERFEPWGWVIGSGVYIDDLNAAWQHDARRLGVFAALAALVATLIVWVLGDSVTRPLASITRSMRQLARGEEVPVPEVQRGDEIGDLTRAMAVFRASLAEREAARRAHELVLREAKTVFDHISEGVMLTDAANRIKLVNPSFSRITGYHPHEVIGRTPSLLASGRHTPAFYRDMYDILARDGEWRGEVWNRTKSGEVYPESLSITALKNADGGIEGYIATFLDITDRKRHEARIRWRAEHDALTGLANRAQFESYLADSVRVARGDSSKVAVIYVDLDGFKPVNDTLGHAMGDKVLRRAAKRIRSVVRTGDLVARLGGDEFAVVITGLADAEDAGRIAAKLVATLGEPFGVSGKTVRVGASVGIALFPDHADGSEALVQAADSAMYQAKRLGRGRFCVHGGPALPVAPAWADATM